MSEATGIHDHVDFKLGRRSPKNAPALMLGPLLTGAVTHPESADHFEEVADWILGENDEFGVCGPVAGANMVLDVSTYLTEQSVTVSQDAIFDLYRRSGNPNFDPKTGEDDNGVDMQTMLEALLKGGIEDRKPIAFAKVDETNHDDLLAAIAIFGGVLLGVDLQIAQQSQTNHLLWDYKESGEWGGHAIYCGRYSDPSGSSKDRTAVITWAEVVDMTDSFIENQLGEAWVVIWPEHLGTKAFQDGIDAQQLAADYEQLTGKVLPVPDGPEPTPTPPQPAPTSSGLDQVSVALADELGQVTSEQVALHPHKSKSKRRVFESRSYLVEIHEK
jgi:hypothetical protein